MGRYNGLGRLRRLRRLPASIGGRCFSLLVADLRSGLQRRATVGALSQTFANQTQAPNLTYGVPPGLAQAFQGGGNPWTSPTWGEAPQQPGPPQGHATTSNSGQTISAVDLQRMCSQSRWSGLPANMRRAAADLYMSMRQGNSDVREWFLRVFGASGDHALWHTACAIDLRIEELLKHGPQGLAWGLENDDILEGSLRQLAAAQEVKRTGDKRFAANVSAFKPPDGSVIPNWLQDESRLHSKALHHEELRNRKGGGFTRTMAASFHPR